VLATLQKIEKRGALETTSRCRVLCSQVFRYAMRSVRRVGHAAAMSARRLKVIQP
jgi:hypothetical protein